MTGYAGPTQLRRLLDAVMSVGSELSLPSLLQRVLEVATELADARYGALGVLDASGARLEQFLTVGIDDETRAKIGNLPEGHGLLGLLILDPKPVRLPVLSEHPDSYGFPPNHPPMTSFLGVPILVRGQVFGNLYLTDKRLGEVFTDVDEELVVALAAAAGIAIENARLHERVAEMAMLADRDRIARDLHDTVIQRLFAIGLTLQGAARLTQLPTVAERIQQAVDDIDRTIRDIRVSIFELNPPAAAQRGTRSAIIELCSELATALGHEPVVRFDGPIDTLVDAALAEQLAAVLRESLTNIARHAVADRTEVSVSVSDSHVELEVSDNGRGFDVDAPVRGNGIANLHARAERLGGSCAIEPGERGGVVVRWTAPLGNTM